MLYVSNFRKMSRMKKSLSHVMERENPFDINCFTHSPTMPTLASHSNANTHTNLGMNPPTGIYPKKNSFVRCKRIRSAVS